MTIVIGQATGLAFTKILACFSSSLSGQGCHFRVLLYWHFVVKAPLSFYIDKYDVLKIPSQFLNPPKLTYFHPSSTPPKEK